MRKNCKEAMQAWAIGKSKKSADSIWTENRVLYSYDTELARWKDDPIVGKRVFYLNMTKYSVTTTNHQNAIYSTLCRIYPNAIFIIFTDLPLRVKDLKSYYPSDYNYTIIHQEAA